MNRQILFKAKRKDNGEWVEGYYVYCRKRRYILQMECCDYCFGHDLTKEECKELSEVFRELAEELEK